MAERWLKHFWLIWLLRTSRASAAEAPGGGLRDGEARKKSTHGPASEREFNERKFNFLQNDFRTKTVNAFSIRNTLRRRRRPGGKERVLFMGDAWDVRVTNLNQRGRFDSLNGCIFRM